MSGLENGERERKLNNLKNDDQDRGFKDVE